MNCYNHPSLPAVAQCPQCNKGLCAECASVYTQPICNVCNRRLITNEKGRIIKELLLTFGIGILVAVLFIEGTMNDGISYPFGFKMMLFVMFFYVFSGVVSGWKTLTRIAPRNFLILPISGVVFFIGWIIGWVIFLIIKLLLSLCVGLIMLPIRTIRNITRLVTLQKIRLQQG